jgi:hypothetical protein
MDAVRSSEMFSATATLPGETNHNTATRIFTVGKTSNLAKVNLFLCLTKYHALKCTLCLIKHQAMNSYGVVGLYFHVFLI